MLLWKKNHKLQCNGLTSNVNSAELTINCTLLNQSDLLIFYRHLIKKVIAQNSNNTLGFSLSNGIKTLIQKSFVRLHETVKHWNFFVGTLIISTLNTYPFYEHTISIRCIIWHGTRDPEACRLVLMKMLSQVVYCFQTLEA